MLAHVNAEGGERGTHMGSMKYMVKNRVQAYQGAAGKRVEMREIAEVTMTEKDSQEKSWYKVYLCERLVEKLLKDKITREMGKFTEVETAFKTIKTATGVGTTNSFVDKFLTKEGAYGDLLGKIADNEKEILIIKS